jgi:hypothetical protein
MKTRKLFRWIYFLALAMGLAGLVGCAAEIARRPTLGEARSGQRPQEGDMTLRAGEVRAEIAEIDQARREIRIITDSGRRDIVPIDMDYTRVIYHGFDYPPDSLEAGDMIAFVPPPRTAPYVLTIRLQIPVQARAATPPARAAARPYLFEGTVERVDYDRGVFDIRPRNGDRVISITLPYNARGADVENFRTLRRGDYVRVEGEFVTTDSVQLMAFLR